MRLLTFRKSGQPTPGLLAASGDRVVDLTIAAPELGASVHDIIACGGDVLGRLEAAGSGASASAMLALADVELVAPIPEPKRNIICVGKNYHEHAKEFHSSGFDASAGKDAIPDCPIIFTKSSTTVIGPGEAIPASSDATASVDYEVELAVVIGRPTRNVARAQAYDHVFGYTIINDVTSRDLQQRHKQWFLGKNLDGFCPMGPYIVTADEVGDISQLRVSTHLNGELRQDASVGDLIFDVPELIETISGVMTLLPGDIIATGTPAGVGIGFKPPKFMKPGDVCRLEITGLGVLESPVA